MKSLICCILLSAFVCSTPVIYNKDISVPIDTVDTLIYPDIETLYSYMIEIGVRFPRVEIAKATLESDWLQNSIARKRQNYIGMKVPGQRYFYGTNPGMFDAYAIYNTWQDCINDLLCWQYQNIYKIKREKTYLDYLDRNYPSKDIRGKGIYKKALISIIDDYDKEF